eukprot:6011-Pelagococcus_subviridis.AAC.1
MLKPDNGTHLAVPRLSVHHEHEVLRRSERLDELFHHGLGEEVRQAADEEPVRGVLGGEIVLAAGGAAGAGAAGGAARAGDEADGREIEVGRRRRRSQRRRDRRVVIVRSPHAQRHAVEHDAVQRDRVRRLLHGSEFDEGEFLLVVHVHVEHGLDAGRGGGLHDAPDRRERVGKERRRARLVRGRGEPADVDAARVSRRLRRRRRAGAEGRSIVQSDGGVELKGVS